MGFRLGTNQGAWLWAGRQGVGVSTAGGDERDRASMWTDERHLEHQGQECPPRGG